MKNSFLSKVLMHPATQGIVKELKHVSHGAEDDFSGANSDPEPE